MCPALTACFRSPNPTKPWSVACHGWCRYGVVRRPDVFVCLCLCLWLRVQEEEGFDPIAVSCALQRTGNQPVEVGTLPQRFTPARTLC